MATINKNLQLRDAEGNLLFPRTTLDQIQKSLNDGTPVSLPVLDGSGKIPESYLPQSAEQVIMLLTCSTVAPAQCATGDMYYNVTQNKVFTATGTNTWGTGVTPSDNKIYVDVEHEVVYRYNGTQMVDVSTHYQLVQTVALDSTAASGTSVPSELAVSVALNRKQDKMHGVAPISIDDAGNASLLYSSGLSVEGNSLTVPPEYITHTVDSLMMRDAGPADQTIAYIDGGTIYTLLGNYGVTDTIRANGSADDTMVATEKAVRDAVQAYVATGGSSVTPGLGIKVTGGSIHADIATNAQIASGTANKVVDAAGLKYALDNKSPWTTIDAKADNSNLTVEAGKAYSVKYTDNNTHTISVGTIQSGAYGEDAHIQLFVKDTANVAFAAPLTLMDPLTPNAGHNLTVKFRNGQANVYVDDTDIGYIVTINNGSEYGSLDYAFNNDVGEYVVFSKSLNGIPIIKSRNSSGNRSVVGNGIAGTTIYCPDGMNCNGSQLSLSNLVVVTSESDIKNVYLTIRNCEVRDSHTDYQVIWPNAGPIISDTVFMNCVSDQRDIIYFMSGGNCDNCSFINCKASQALIGSWSSPVNLSNCLFVSSDTNSYAFQIRNTTTASVAGCTFSSSHDAVRLATATTQLTISGFNILNSTLSGPGKLILAAGTTISSPTKTGVIDLTGNTQAARLSNMERLEGLTIKNQKYTNAIYILNQNNTVIKDCVITGNTQLSSGSGIFAQNSTSNGVVSVVGCTFSSNSARYINAAMYIEGGTYYFENILLGEPGDEGIIPPGYTFTLVHHQSIQIGNADARNNFPTKEVTVNGMTFTGLSILNNSNHGCMYTKIHLTLGSHIYATDHADGAVINANGQPAIIAIGVQAGDSFNITSSVTVHTNINTTVALTGCGTIIYANGNHDFTIPYTLSVASGTGENSLYYGIFTRTERWLLVDASLSTLTATFSTAKTGRNFCLMTSEGQGIVGFNQMYTLAAGTTISVTLAKDTKGNIDVSGSTVLLTGATCEVGTGYITGTLWLGGQNLRWRNGTTLWCNHLGKIDGSNTVSGGTHACIIPSANGTFTLSRCSVQNVSFAGFGSSTVTINYATIKGTGANGWYNGVQTRGVFWQVKTINMSYCNVDMDTSKVCLYEDSATVTCTNCNFIKGTNTGNGKYVYTTCKFESNFSHSIYSTIAKGGVYLYNCTVDGGQFGFAVGDDKEIIIHTTSSKVFKGKITKPSSGTNYICIVKGTTLDLRNNTNSDPIMATTQADGIIVVGSSGSTAADGTATIITSSGTFKVSGTGSYINKSGTGTAFTDLTIG